MAVATAVGFGVAVAGAPPAAAASGGGPVEYTTSVHGDDADVYAPGGRARLPVVLLLQGANVGRAHYAPFARAVAALGFAVVVPDHRRSVLGQTGLYAEEAQAMWTVDWMRAEDGRAGSRCAPASTRALSSLPGTRSGARPG
ncbi:hypothetical protein ACFQHO_01635 [Actinomadura yumaensis]|uniref:hypothetical protein n=1 Tax=Actinomadura yumaensis TaxID=111807 RepID=UPI00361629EE